MRLDRHSPAEVPGMVDELRDLYAEAYDEAPYHYTDADVVEFVARLTRQTRRPGFVLITCRDGAGTLAGFSYGHVFEPGAWWGGAKTDPPSRVRNVSKFAVIELLVRPAYRGNGYATRLMNSLLTDRGEEYAMLLAKPDAMAHHMYLRWGWQVVGQVQSYETWAADDALVLPLAAAEQARIA